MLSAASARDNAVLTTPQLALDLREIDHVIAALRRCNSNDAEDLFDLQWLQLRRRYVLAVLASRRQQKTGKVVRLDQWRSGGIIPEAIAAVA